MAAAVVMTYYPDDSALCMSGTVVHLQSIYFGHKTVAEAWHCHFSLPPSTKLHVEQIRFNAGTCSTAYLHRQEY
jgi:hypothetical protein